MSYMDSYKKLDNLCKDALKSEVGITEYIECMERCAGASASVQGWDDDYYKLKHYRYVRNQIAHEVGASESDLCKSGDVKWLDGFYQRIMKRTDPLAQYQKLRGSKKQRTGKSVKTTDRNGSNGGIIEAVTSFFKSVFKK